MSNTTGCSTPAKQQKLDGVSSRGARPRWALKQQPVSMQRVFPL